MIEEIVANSGKMNERQVEGFLRHVCLAQILYCGDYRVHCHVGKWRHLRLAKTKDDAIKMARQLKTDNPEFVVYWNSIGRRRNR